ncbi:DNA-damage-repair/toleration protein drt100-like protein [Trifolium pratense]|uniref:Uncharacterized protein n=2 Tax=Trifolium pratense TaxID=57577 RepID=A0ACB0IGJ5_TRIPR|nr:DNA damage-repair/toleration protein DRT102-like [Trifolium pratense]PNY06794.1 DNA-damage-repair/toleration protein drt100-like protein [Trifolium pratense]CAJ2631166.1 unnamed protein product [Trifolium pratense]
MNFTLLPFIIIPSALAQVGRRVSQSALSSSSPEEVRGLVACGTGAGVSIFANKFPGVFATTCLTPSDAVNARSINNSNVLALSGRYTSTETAIEIVDAWLNTPFKSPCPANDNRPWPHEMDKFLDKSQIEMPKIGKEDTVDTCAVCSLAVNNRELNPINLLPGGSIKIFRESPTSALVRFKAGSIEPAHHHTFGHDFVVIEGKMSVWNVTKEEMYDLTVGDYLFTPAGDVHRVKYYEDTELFIKWDGHWDIFFDEDIDDAAANTAIHTELPN